MSGVGFYMTTPETTLDAATAETVIEVTAAANHRAHITKTIVSFKGKTVTNEPVTVELIRIGTTGTGTSGTATKVDPDMSETLQTSFKHTMTVEPTGITVLETYYIHPQGLLVEYLPIEAPIPIPGGDLWGVRCTADEAVTVGVSLKGNE